MDYLSFLTLRLERCPDRPDLDGQDYIVLNSTSDLSKAIRPLGGYESIHCFLDNDKAGIEAVQELQKEYGLRIRDASHIYEGYNDLNDFLRDKRSGQAQRQQEKPEAEKRQSQTEQPKKKRQRDQDVAAQPPEGFEKSHSSLGLFLYAMHTLLKKPQRAIGAPPLWKPRLPCGIKARQGKY